MRFKFLVCSALAVLFFSCSLKAQELDILDENLELRNVRLEQNSFNASYGTHGVLLIFESKYKSNTGQVLSFPQEFSLTKYGEELYRDTASWLLIRPNQWTSNRKFIPYRNLHIDAGQQDLELRIKVHKLFNYKAIVRLDQPIRYAVQLILEEAVAKRKAGRWDRGRPDQSPPDLYWTLTTNDGDFPLFSSTTSPNSFRLDSSSVLVYVLEGEKISLNIFDEDEGEDECLGTYVLSDSVHVDWKAEQKGRMFGQVKGLSYRYTQQKMLRQPISTYLRPQLTYKNRKGVQLIFDYFFSKAMAGQQMRLEIQFKDKAGQFLDVPFYYSCNEAPMSGDLFQLKQKGSWVYFIPFYAWNAAIYSVEIALIDANNNRVEAAPYFIHQPIEFENYIYFSGFLMEENYQFQGVSGLKLSANYQIQELHQYAAIECSFLNASGQYADAAVYPILNELNTIPPPIPQQPYRIEKIKKLDTLSFFIPYIDCKEDYIRMKLDFVPDMRIPLIDETTSIIEIPNNYRDATTQKNKEEAVFVEGDFGHVITMDYQLPVFYRNRAFVQVQVMKNGLASEDYLLLGDQLKQLSVDTFSISKGAGTLQLVFPYRKYEANDELSVNCRIIEQKTGKELSKPVLSSFVIPAGVQNLEVDVMLKQLRFNKELPENEVGEVDWNYVLKVGSETKINKRLPQKVKGKAVVQNFSKRLKLHIEDLMVLKLVHKTTLKEIVLWEGDLGKFKQFKYRSVIKDRGPIKKAKVSAKTRWPQQKRAGRRFFLKRLF